jgi:hypothetical protein
VTISLPRNDKRTAIIGSTGSGKTQLAFWLLSTRYNPRRVCFIFDFKGESLIEELEYLGAQEISCYGNLPTKPGIYILRPIPERDDKAVQEFLWKIWAKGNCLVWIDEGYMLGARNPALNACLTQGRSKHIEMMILSQRPVWMSKFVFSEANYFAVMNLTLEDDRKFVSGYVGGNKIQLLPKYHSYWYSADEQKGAILAPVPGRDELLARFDLMLSKKRKKI